MNTIAMISVIWGFMSAFIIAADLANRKQSMKIMNSVWVLTALWAGVLGLIAYFWFGRGKRASIAMPKMDGISGIDMSEIKDMVMSDMPMGEKPMSDMSMEEMGDMGKRATRPHWQSVVLSTLHCGAGCTLADLCGEWFLFFVPVLIGGSALLGSVVVDYLLALMIGVWFQYMAMRAMQSKSLVNSTDQLLKRAFKADFWSLTAWQVGMYGFMAIAFFVIFPTLELARNSWTFWFMMQIAMLFGFATAYPVNAVLIKRKIKMIM